jgi:Uma2 family endonuclease
MDYRDPRRDCVLMKRGAAVTTLEYFETPESLLPTELVFGTLRVRDAPSADHQSAVGAFFVALREFVRARNLGEVWIAPLDVVLDEARALIVQPDLLYVARDRASIVRRRVYGAPDLVVEVLSPKPRVGDLDQRLGWFAAFGARECWAYHQTAQRLELITFVGGAIDRRLLIGLDEQIPSVCLPEFPLTLREILDR